MPLWGPLILSEYHCIELLCLRFSPSHEEYLVFMNFLHKTITVRIQVFIYWCFFCQTFHAPLLWDGQCIFNIVDIPFTAVKINSNMLETRFHFSPTIKTSLEDSLVSSNTMLSSPKLLHAFVQRFDLKTFKYNNTYSLETSSKWRWMLFWRNWITGSSFTDLQWRKSCSAIYIYIWKSRTSLCSQNFNKHTS